MQKRISLISDYAFYFLVLGASLSTFLVNKSFSSSLSLDGKEAQRPLISF